MAPANLFKLRIPNYSHTYFSVIIKTAMAALAIGTYKNIIKQKKTYILLKQLQLNNE